MSDPKHGKAGLSKSRALRKKFGALKTAIDEQ
jgi:hypothetical protein